ncbi:MAG: hypothetical protein IKH15_07260, partial [Bacteroidales bacterium]|nr:hypothetical protein [Bacteroidales bacterium]
WDLLRVFFLSDVAILLLALDFVWDLLQVFSCLLLLFSCLLWALFGTCCEFFPACCCYSLACFGFCLGLVASFFPI